MGHLGEIARIVEALTSKDVLDIAGKAFGPLCIALHLLWQKLRGARRAAEPAVADPLDARFMQNAVLDNANKTSEIDALTRERDYFQARWEEEQKQCVFWQMQTQAVQAQLKIAADDLGRRNAILIDELGVTPEEGIQEYRLWKLRDLAERRAAQHAAEDD